MSILIKGIDTPKDEELIVIYPDGYAEKYSRSSVAFIDFPIALPRKVIEVPTPHGDLIDREELLENAGGVYTARPEEAQKIQREINKVLFAIKDAPTVIEAEGK